MARTISISFEDFGNVAVVRENGGSERRIQNSQIAVSIWQIARMLDMGWLPTNQIIFSEKDDASTQDSRE